MVSGQDWLGLADPVTQMAAWMRRTTFAARLRLTGLALLSSARDGRTTRMHDRRGASPASPPDSAAGTDRKSHGRVLIVCPGGLEHGGGIGRMMGYFLGALDGVASPPAYAVIDSRGPWFLGAARLKSVLSAYYLAACAVRLVAARRSRDAVLAHINITGRGSTLRKWVLAGAARRFGLTYVLHVHDYDYAADYRRRGARQQAMVRRMFQGAAHVIVLGTTDQKTLQDMLRLKPERISVLHNAVPDPEPKLAKPEGPIRLLFLGYLSERKGVPELLEALADPALARLDWRATLAGGGDIAFYHEKAAAFGIGNRIDFPGWLDRPAVAEACANASILALPSHAEGLAMAVLEGLSYGLAVITTPVGAHREVIEDGVSGLLLPPRDPAALTAALQRVMCDGALHARLQQGARARFLNAFEIRSYASRLAGLHTTLLEEIAARSARQ